MIRSFTCLALLLALGAGPADAGQACREEPATARRIATAASAAIQVYRALEESEAEIAFVARAGQDLSGYGLHYSHAALAVRDHPAGPWTVVHLLNECGRGDSGLYAEGLVNFFIPGDHAALLVVPDPATQKALLEALGRRWEITLHEPRYNVVAHPYSVRDQNSNQWLLELLALSLDARPGSSIRPTRTRAQAALARTHFQPDRIRIPRSQRIFGGLFQANLNFRSQPLSNRLASRYDVISVRSLVRYLEARGGVMLRREIRVRGPQAVNRGSP